MCLLFTIPTYLCIYLFKQTSELCARDNTPHFYIALETKPKPKSKLMYNTSIIFMNIGNWQ